MKLDYIVSYDRQSPTAWVEFPNPLGGTSTGSIPVTDPEIIAKAEELNALVASKLGLERREIVPPEALPEVLPDPTA